MKAKFVKESMLKGPSDEELDKRLRKAKINELYDFFLPKYPVFHWKGYEVTWDDVVGVLSINTSYGDKEERQERKYAQKRARQWWRGYKKAIRILAKKAKDDEEITMQSYIKNALKSLSTQDKIDLASSKERTLEVSNGLEAHVV